MAEPLRVLAVSHAYPRRSATGHGIFVHRWNVGLLAHGVDVRVLQLAEWAPPWPLSEIDPAWRRGRSAYRDMIAERDGVRIYHPRTFSPRPSRLFPGDAWDREARTLIDYCRRRAELRTADVVIGHLLVPDGYHAMRLASALGIPVAGVAWGDDVHAWPRERPYWRNRLREVLSEIDAPIACSQRLARDGNAWLDRPREDWQVVYGGVDEEVFHPAADRFAARAAAPVELMRALPRDACVALMIGQRVRAKGYLELLDAWKQLGPQGWHLVAAGADSGDVDVVREIDARGLAESVHWVGPQRAESMPALLRAADAFVLPSHDEGLSLTMLEAMASGLPTIATDVGGHAEVITDSSEGWLIPARDPRPLESALRELTSSESERTRRGRGARSAALRIGSPAVNARRLAAILAAVAERRLLGRRAIAV
jgi:glycosyltransferase involved in cell wall biosynthesis